MTDISLRWRPTPTLHGMATVSLIGLVAAAVLHSGTVVVLVVPELLWLAAYARPSLPSGVVMEVDCAQRRCLERQEVQATLVVQAPAGLCVDASCDATGAGSADLHRKADIATFRWTVRPEPWGRRPLCRGSVTLTRTGGLWMARLHLTWPVVTVLPAAELVRHTVTSSRLRSAPGAHLARLTAQSGQTSGTAPYAVGTPVRRVHWPQTLRHRALHVTTFEAERDQDVVLVVDALVEVGVEGQTTVDRAVRAAASLARAHIRDGDRVGLVVATPALAWVLPGSGDHHLARLLDRLSGLRGLFSMLPPELDRVPPAAVPPGSLVVMLSPLLHEHSARLAVELRRSGHPLVVIDVLTTEPVDWADRHFTRTAHRLWRLDRAATKAAMADRGILVLDWPLGDSLDGLVHTHLARPLPSAPISGTAS